MFQGFDFVIATLRVIDEPELRRRVMHDSRSSGYRDWQESARINRQLLQRPPFPNESFIDIGTEPIEEIADTVLELTRRHNGS